MGAGVWFLTVDEEVLVRPLRQDEPVVLVVQELVVVVVHDAGHLRVLHELLQRGARHEVGTGDGVSNPPA